MFYGSVSYAVPVAPNASLTKDACCSNKYNDYECMYNAQSGHLNNLSTFSTWQS